MFNSGLLATFIPEILMIIGFFLCLLTPGFKANNSSDEQVTIVAHISATKQIRSNTYSTTVSDFHCSKLITVENHHKFICKSTDSEISIEEFVLELSDGLTFKQFSRPPPDIIS